jgi:hypothetical protein
MEVRHVHVLLATRTLSPNNERWDAQHLQNVFSSFFFYQIFNLLFRSEKTKRSHQHAWMQLWLYLLCMLRWMNSYTCCCFGVIHSPRRFITGVRNAVEWTPSPPPPQTPAWLIRAPPPALSGVLSTTDAPTDSDGPRQSRLTEAG